MDVTGTLLVVERFSVNLSSVKRFFFKINIFKEVIAAME